MEPLSVVTGALMAMGLGGLVGLEREFGKEVEKRKLLIGIRTSMFLCLLGFMSVIFQEFIDLNWSIGFGLASTLVALSLSYWSRMRLYKATGITTFVAGILIFITGVLIGFGENLLAVVLAVMVTSVLAVRKELHLIVKSMNRKELLSAIKFSIITFVILPLLPNQTIDPFGVFNPYQFWLIVVIVSLIQFFSFILMRTFENKGEPIIGFFGGFVNSEATAYTLAECHANRKNKKDVFPSILLTISAMILSCIVVASIIYPSYDFIIKLSLNLVPTFLFLFVIASLKMKFGKVKSKIESPYSLISAMKFALVFFALTFVGDFIINFSLFLLLPVSFFVGMIAATPVVASMALLVSSGNLTISSGAMAISFAIVGSILNKNFWSRIIKDKKVSRQILQYTISACLLTLTMTLLLS